MNSADPTATADATAASSSGGAMASSSGGGAVAEKLIGLAKNLLSAGKFPASKKLALEALESDPLVSGADEIIAVADVLLASDCLADNRPNPHAVLQLSPTADPGALRRSYRRLSLLLHQSPLPGAAAAARLVADAFAVLSTVPVTFWTACTSCFHVHQYGSKYLGCRMLCQTCRKPFTATALIAEPQVVPGTEMYYCAWGCVPLGFPSGNAGEYTPFYPESSNAGVTEPVRKKQVVSRKQKVVVKRKRMAESEDEEGREVDLNAESEFRETRGKGLVVDLDDDDMASFELDLDASDIDASGELLDNVSP